MTGARFACWACCGALVAGCGGDVDEAAAPAAAEDERPTVVETRWTDQSELFVEFPTLVVGETSRFAIHFTDLASFAPVRSGRAVVRLTGAGGSEFTVESPGRPGIFGVDVTPPRPGSFGLVLELESEGLRDRHDLGTVTVESPGRVWPPEAEGDEGEIPFLKEQQWTLDFATALVERRTVSNSLAIAAAIEPRTGGRVEVAAPVAGRVRGDRPVRPVGTAVSLGEPLTEIIPHSGHGEDRPALQLAVAEARDAQELARAELARVDRLVELGALPARRQLEARLAVQTAGARVTASEAHLAQLDATREGRVEGPGDIGFVLRAPMGGILAATHLTAGASVEEGAPLFQIVALDRVHVVGALPEAELARVHEVSGAELLAPGLPSIRLDRLVAIGRVLETDSRTVPIIYELADPDPRLAIGQAVTLRLFLSPGVDAVTVPTTAVVDDGGRPVVFVQTSGEGFERRAIEVGNREGELVQVSGDIEAGERVVVRGAPFIRLAALSPQVPAHGHTH